MELARSLVTPFGQLLAGLFVLLEVDHSNVGLITSPGAQHDLADVHELNEDHGGRDCADLWQARWRSMESDVEASMAILWVKWGETGYS